MIFPYLTFYTVFLRTRKTGQFASDFSSHFDLAQLGVVAVEVVLNLMKKLFDSVFNFL